MMAATPSDHVITLADVKAAHERIAPHIHLTPVLTCHTLDRFASDGACGPRELFFKCELFQKSGSFKARGAFNAILSLRGDASRGVCTHSSGNHAQAVAVAARGRCIPAHIVMPSNCPAVKRAAVLGYGATVIECAPTQAAREAACREVESATGAEFIHPSEDARVIAGQGTMALELLAQVAGMDAVIVPIGGGGMTSGVATVIKETDARIRVIAAEPLAASDAYRSKAEGRIQGHDTPPQTIADGLKTTLGPATWPCVRDYVDEIVCVSEEEIVAAMKHVYERMKLVIEPSAAVGVAAALSPVVKAMPGLRRVAIILCGGNVDVTALPFVVK